VIASLATRSQVLEPIEELAERSWVGPSMGGRLTIRVACSRADASRAAQDLVRVASRIASWAGRLTRFTSTSDLARLNADSSRPRSAARPTLAAILDWAERAADLTEGVTDVTLLDARLVAEGAVPDHRAAGTEVGSAADGSAPTAFAVPTTAGDTRGPVRPGWWLERGARSSVVHRRVPVRFDLDGVGKGWIADRALGLLSRYPAAFVDADGDIALRTGGDVEWWIGVADPRAEDAADLAAFRFGGQIPGPLGLATSGTSVHRWKRDGHRHHHLIDPRTSLPAVTDVVQATVLSSSARRAEVLAKSVVILGADEGFALLERARALGAVLLLENGEVVATPDSMAWLA
jgi:FAD:protein FMN transferase